MPFKYKRTHVVVIVVGGGEEEDWWWWHHKWLVGVITAVPRRVKATVIIKQPHVGRHLWRRWRWRDRFGWVGDPDKADVSPGSDDISWRYAMVFARLYIICKKKEREKKKKTELKVIRRSGIIIAECQNTARLRGVGGRRRERLYLYTSSSSIRW